MFETIKRNSEFQKLYKRAKRYHSSSIILFFMQGDTKRFGITVSKKIGNAVARNRTKRQLRTIIHKRYLNLKDGDFVIVAKGGIDKKRFLDIELDIDRILKKESLYLKRE